MEIFEQIAQIIKNSEGLLITAGAGIGVDSGLPDFRGPEGFWKAYPPLQKYGIRFEQMANPIWFERNPKMAWAFYGHRFNLYKNTTPHNGFQILRKWCERKNNNYFIVTSNVDGQFQKAGFSEDKILEIHGTINLLQCTQNCTRNLWEPDFDEIIIDMDKFEALDPLPTCPNCGAIARPNILMFGDWAWNSSNSDQQEIRYSLWLRTNADKSLVVIEIGAGTGVPTIRLTSEEIVANYDAKLIRINPRDYYVPAGHYSLALGALEALKKIDSYFD